MSDSDTNSSEAHLPSEPELIKLGLQRTSDGLISWRSDSEDHPRNWSILRKSFDTSVIIFLEFFVTVVSTTGASAFGGLFTPALSELIGRRAPYLVSCAVYSTFCFLTGIVPHHSAVWIGRFITGFASAVPAVVTAGSIHDMYDGKQRVWLVVLWNAGSTAGLCLGPVYGTYIATTLTWRWVFHVSAIITAGCFLCLLGVRESRPSQIMKRKIEILRRQGVVEQLEWFNPDHSPDFKSLVRLVVIQPVRLLGTEPIVAMVTVISAVSWGIIYLFTESLPGIYMSISDGLTREMASLVFLAFVPGVMLSFIPRFWDRRAVGRRVEMGQRIEPEDKVTGFAVAAPALAAGLLWFAWTVPPATKVHWVVPTLALIPVGFAVNEMSYTLAAYLTDAYLLYAASAFCGLAFVRALVSGVMPLVAQQMYPALGTNIAGTVVGCFGLVFCLAPWVFLRYGKRLREKSPFARHSLDSHLKSQAVSESMFEKL
ncbi:hypothetical protein OQA88_13067 [Cercophora sp. LCS_1]